MKHFFIPYNIKHSGSQGPLLHVLAAFAAASGLALLLSSILSANLADTLRAFFIAPIYSRAAFLSMFEAAAPLALCALGVVITYRAGHYSLGGEGQLYGGAFSAVLFVSLFPNANAPLSLALALLGGIAGGALVALPPALGRRFRGADVLLTSILVSQGCIFVIDWAIAGPFRDTSANLIAMKSVPHMLARIAPPASLTAAPFFVLFFCIVGSLYFERTQSGLAHEMYGRNVQFARLAGFNVGLLAWLPIAASGMFHGLAGALIVLSTNGTLIRGMSGGMGFTAIGVALIARLRPLGLPFAAVLFAWLDSAARQASILSDLPPDAGTLIKAAVIMMMSARPAFSLLAKKYTETS